MTTATFVHQKAALASPEEAGLLGLVPEFQWLVGECVLANSLVDRDFERFGADVLADFARTLPGKSVLIGHDHEGLPQGVWVKAAVESVGDIAELRAWYAIPVLKDETNVGLRGRIESGVAKYVSIGFRAGKLVCDECGQPLWGAGSACQHWPGMELPDGRICTATWQAPGEALEGSIVYLGSQYGAALKDADAAPMELAGVGRHRVKHATADGALVLSWPDLACAAVRIAGARGADGLSDDERAEAWLEVDHAYRLAEKAAPAWRPGMKFDWALFGDEERAVWFERELAEECPRMAEALLGRVKGAIAQLPEREGPLPSALAEVLATLAELAGLNLPGDEAAEGAKVGRIQAVRNRERLERATSALQEASDALAEILAELSPSESADKPQDDKAAEPDAAPVRDLPDPLLRALAAYKPIERAPLAGLLRVG